MGGAVGGNFTAAPLGHIAGQGPRIGNTTPWAEFNMDCDPEAGASLFSNPLLASKTTLIPLDVTHLVLADVSIQQQLLRGPFTTLPSLLRQMLHELLMFFAYTYASVFGLTAGPPLHDPVAVAVVLDAELGAVGFDDHSGERWLVRVVTDGVHSARDEESGQLGRTLIEAVSEGGQGVRIPRSLDVGRFWEGLQRCVSKAAGDGDAMSGYESEAL